MPLSAGVVGNALSGAFFGLRSPAFGLAVIVALLVAVVAPTALFARIDAGRRHS